MEWIPFYYYGRLTNFESTETNIECTKCGKVRRVEKIWLKKNTKKFKTGEVDFKKLIPKDGKYQRLTIQIKGYNSKVEEIQRIICVTFGSHTIDGQKSNVDHIDNNPLNNNINNLISITQRENTSKAALLHKVSNLPLGVVYEKNRSKKYKAQIKINGITYNLGRFLTSDIASEAYQKKLNEIKSI